MNSDAKKALGASKQYVDETLKGEGALKGKDGDSAYQIAVKKGFIGTEEEWLESLKGSGVIVYVSSKPQKELYDFKQAIEDSIIEVLKTPEAKDGALISVVQPFNDGATTLMGSGFILDHGDEVWSGSMTFTVPTPITSINIVGAYDFQYIHSTNQLAIEKKIHGFELEKYAVALQQSVEDAGKSLVIGKDGKVKPGVGQGGGGDAKDITYENESHQDVTNVENALDKLYSKVYYVTPAINSFSAVPNATTYEIGKTIDSIDFTWTLNKNVASQSLTNVTVDVDDREATYSTPLSSYKKFTLSVEDAEGGKASKSLEFNFLPYVYYGGANLPSTPDSEFILGLSSKAFKSNALGTYTMTPADGAYGFLAIPSKYAFNGTAKVGGFDTELKLVDTVSVTNASGYTQDYKLWRMPNPSTGAQISIVI